MQAVVICPWSSRAAGGQGSAARASIAPVAWVRQRSIHSGHRQADGRMSRNQKTEPKQKDRNKK